MRLIENATGLRRFLVLAGLLAMTWLAVVVVGSLAATALSAAASLQPTSGGTGLSLSEAVHRVPRALVEALASAAVLTVAPFLPASMNLGDRSLLFGAWLPFMSIIVSGTLISLPLVGLRNRGKLPLRWSIVSGGVLGGMLGIGTVLLVLDGIRLLDLSDPLAQVTATGGRMSAMAVLLLACWIVTGWMWARALARAGRAGHPDGHRPVRAPAVRGHLRGAGDRGADLRLGHPSQRLLVRLGQLVQHRGRRGHPDGAVRPHAGAAVDAGGAIAVDADLLPGLRLSAAHRLGGLLGVWVEGALGT